MIKSLINYKKNKRIIGVLLFVYLLASIFIGFFRFTPSSIELRINGTALEAVENANLSWDNDDTNIVAFKKNQNEIAFILNSEEIAKGGNPTIHLAHQASISIEEFEIVRNHIPVKSIKMIELPNYTSYVNNESVLSEMKFNESFSALLRYTSSSLLQERIIVVGLLTLLLVLLSAGVLGMTYLRNIGLQNQIKKDQAYNWTDRSIGRFWRDIRKYSYYIGYSAKTDLKAEVANSYLNWLWWILEPFFNMLVYVIVFGKIMGNSIENYATYVFSALLMWNFFNKTINYSVKLVRNNKDIVTKIYIPKFILLLSNMVLNIFKLLFSLMVLTAMMFVFRVSVDYHILWNIPIYITLCLFTFGLGMIFLHYGVFIDDLSYAVGILLNMLMFLSGIFYDVFATLPAPLNKIMLTCNPLAMLIKMMRDSLLYKTGPDVLMLGIWFAISVALCYIGTRIVYKNENSYVKVV